MFKNILVPVDVANIEHMNYSMDLAEKLLDEGGKITVLNVVENLPEDILAELPGRFVETARNKSRAQLQNQLKEKNRSAEVLVEAGHPAGTIVEIAERDNFDLVIIASHKPNLMNYLLGSTADRVIRRAKCPVFVTR